MQQGTEIALTSVSPPFVKSYVREWEGAHVNPGNSFTAFEGDEIKGLINSIKEDRFAFENLNSTSLKA
jgi:hypothetical protein